MGLALMLAGSPHAGAASPADPPGTRSETPAAVRGVLDLSESPAGRSGGTKLVGEWEFYWRQLLTPDDLKAGSQTAGPAYMAVPGIWSDYRDNGAPLPNKGYATYRLVLRLPVGEAQHIQALYIPSVATSYRLWVDGAELGGRGVVGTSKETMSPKNVPNVYYFQPVRDRIELVVQVSSFVQRKGGLWETIRFGDGETITHWRNRMIVTEVIVFGSIFMMAVYHLGLYAFRREDKSPLYFGGVCLAVSLRIAVLGQTMAVYLFPSFPWEAAVKVEYLSVAFGFYWLLLFTQSQYPEESVRFAKRISLAINGVMTGIVVATPASFYTELFIPYILLGALPTVLYVTYVYGLAAVRRRQGSVLNGVGFVFFSATIANDVLFYTQWVNEGNFIPFGLLAFLLTQSLNLAGRFSHAFRQSARLSAEMKTINESLEQKVEVRTKELRESNDQLEERNRELNRMEHSRRQLLSTISHELGTPLTSIQGYIKLMLDGVIRADEPRTLQLIYGKTLYLDRIIQDLFELSKLEAMQLRFHLQDVPAEVYLRKLAESHTWAGGEPGENTVTMVAKGMELPKGASLRIDPVRIEQVLANFVTNARKFTPPEGMIRIGWAAATLPGTGEPAVRVEVADTGIGIAAEELDSVFERFYRGTGKGQLNARLEGAGLGLAISKQIVVQHGGVIGVNSEPDRGSVFYFIIPLQVEAAEELATG